MLQYRSEEISYRVSYVGCGKSIRMNRDQGQVDDTLIHCYCRHQRAVLIKPVLLSYLLVGSGGSVALLDDAV